MRRRSVRNEWRDGRVERGPGRYREWAAQTARDSGAALIDLTALIAEQYERQGQEAVRAYFGPDPTHTSPTGAALNARLVAAGLRALQGQDFGRYLSEADPAVGPR